MFTKLLDDSAGIEETVLAVSRFMKRLREANRIRITAGRRLGKIVQVVLKQEDEWTGQA